MHLTVIRDGNVLTLRFDTPRSAFAALVCDRLSYMYRTRDFRGNLKLERRQLYNCVSDTEYITTLGMWPTIQKVLHNTEGVTLEFRDDTPEDRKLSALPNWDNVADLTFRPGQKEAIQAIIRNTGGIVCAPTGFGKTFLIGALCKLFPKARIHISTKSVEIARRIANDLKRFIANVGMIGGGKDEAGARVLVITSDSLHKSPGDADFFFYDECHQAAAESYTENILTTYNYAKRIGFTATPDGRSDGADRVLSMLFGSIIFDMDYSQGVDLGLVVPIKVRWLQCNTASPVALAYQKPVSRKRYCIWRNTARNNVIANDVRTNYPNDSVLILVETVEHAVHLHNVLPEFELCYATMTPDDLVEYKSLGLLPEDYEILTKKDRLQLCNDFLTGKVKKVISTDVWSTGVDFPSLSVVYSVSSRVSKILTTQGAGRVSRIFNGKDYGEVVDVQDIFANDFKSFAAKRYKVYKDLGWTQEDYLKGRTNG